MSGYHLAFEIAENYFRVARLDNGRANLLLARLFEGRKDFQYKEQLSKAIADLNLSSEPDEITVTWVDRHATLVPGSVFEPALIPDLFAASFNKKPVPSELDYNRLPVEGIVNVYEVPLWLKSFFVIRYPRVQISHIHTPIIKALTRLPGIHAHVLCLIAPEQCYVWISRQDQLMFVNQYEVASEEDVLYYLSFALQQQQSHIPKGKLILDYTDDISGLDAKKMESLIKQIPVLTAFELTPHPIFTLQAHQFCV